MKKFFQKIRTSIVLFFHGIFWGLRSADLTIQSQTNGDGEEINHKLEVGGNVYDDMLQEKETQRVQETRDAAYRVYREADKYEVQLSGMREDGANFDDEDSVLTAKATKKASVDKPKTPVYETNGYKTILVQNAKEYENDIVTKQKEAETGQVIDDVSTLIFEVKYKDSLTPRFRVERYIQKLVLKESKEGKLRMNLYFSQYARQFVKRDSLFVAELSSIFAGKRHSDILELESISFISDKAFGIEDLHRITLTKIQYVEIVVFDGSFVIEFDCEKDDLDVVAKYRTKELDEKYAIMAPKHDAVDIGAWQRKIEKETKKMEENNFETTTLKIE